MAQPNVNEYAKLLLARQAAANGIWFYVSRVWRRQLLFLVGYITIPIVLWEMDMPTLAVAVGGFFSGAIIRDLRWWSASAKQWPTTSELLDWPKIEALANAEDRSLSDLTA